MSCHHNFDRRVLVTLFGKAYVKTELRYQQEERLFKREMPMMRESQQEIEVEERIAAVNKEIAVLKAHNQKVRTDLVAAYLSKKNKVVPKDVVSMEIDTYKMRKRGLDITMNGLKKMKHDINTTFKEQLRYAIRCPKGECKGFVPCTSDKMWTCGMCKTFTCGDCYISVENNVHVCLEDNKATTRYLKENTKPCPSCGVFIHKIDGCNQMWCLGCHVAFDFITLEIEKREIHNPHFYEHHRALNLANLPIVGTVGEPLPTIDEIIEVWEKQELPNLVFVEFVHYADLILRLEEKIMKLPHEFRLVDNTNLRKVYLKGHLPETVFKAMLYRRDKNHKKMCAFRYGLIIYVYHAQELIRKSLHISPASSITSADILRSLYELTTHSNTFFAEIAYVFDSKKIMTLQDFC